MEADIKRPTNPQERLGYGLIAFPWLSASNMAGAALGGFCYGLLAVLSLWLTRSEATLAAVWLPNAFAVAFLLRARLPSEIPFFSAIFAASCLGNIVAGTPVTMAIGFSVANIAAIGIITWSVRRACGPHPDMNEVSDLAWFVWAGGLVGPFVSSSLAVIVLSPSGNDIWANAVGWFLSESVAMILIVPTALLLFDALKERGGIPFSVIAERTLLLLLGMLAVFMVFAQGELQLLFLIPPITLLHAFRLGSLGTAVFVAVLAILAVTMTSLGAGPLAAAVNSETLRLYLIQAFIAANFLTGLPVAAVLAGRERMMEAMGADKRELDMMAENITDAVFRYDLQGYCTYASRSTREVLDASPSEFIGKRPSDRMHADSKHLISMAQQRLLGGESDKERFTYRRFNDARDGSAAFVEAECAVAHNPITGEAEGIIVAVRDVTDRVELENQLTSERQRAENGAQAKSEFLANMSHEIRTPMNGVLGFAEMMLETDLNAAQRRYMEMIVESGRSMTLLLNDILDLSKIEAGQVAIDPGPVDLHSTILDCAALQRPAAEKKGLDLRIEFKVAETDGPLEDEDADSESHGKPSPDEYPWILTDGLRVRQILLNLIGNAVKFTKDGHVSVVCIISDCDVSVKVIDTGIGISEARIDSIFSPFTQGESNTARRFGGTGLGLSISCQLAQLLGGTITVESEPGAGSEFTLKLPAAVVEAEKARPDETEQEITHENAAHRLQSARILLAEDQEINRILVSEMLERFGQDVAIAHDGNEAISMVIDGMVRDRPFDLILMDVQMPGCDGYAATRAIRAEGIGPNTLPIIALTANAFPEDVAAARKAGMQTHLAKPLVFSDLAKVLQRWLPTRIIVDDDREPHLPELPMPKRYSPDVLSRWQARRAKTIDAVRSAIESGQLSKADAHEGESTTLVRLLHKLAGTAAIFSEPKLGEQASALERAIKSQRNDEEVRALARGFMELADALPGRSEAT